MMLVLKRKPSELICIGDNITVMVIRSHAGNVWLGVSAPKDVEVDRQEIRLKKNAERKSDDGSKAGE